MPLTPHTKLRHYEVVEAIGVGGMGEVYRARDTKLGREVAIKVLPEALSQDRERLTRFEREAKLLAALNHPALAHLYGFEEADGTTFLIMELVEGETLAERIARGPIPVDEALSLFVQIADGLEAAHEKAIIHRDLKPANIKITPDGRIKILDFGLAKAFAREEDVSAETSQSPTLTKGTALGVIMGTASYMSPEQARGKRVDKRTDIWAFGCCLYEALTAKKTFPGETVSDVIGAVMRAEPELDRIPGVVQVLVRRCLQKNPRERLRDIGDARLELGEARHESTPASEPARSGSTRWLPWAVTTVLAGALLWTLSTDEGPEDSGLSRRFTLTPPELPETATIIALSSDGRHLAYVGRPYGERERIFIQDLHQGTARELDGTEGANFPFFSPDGDSIGFFAEGQLRKVELDGGPSQTMCDIAEFLGGSWTTNGDIVYGSARAGLFIVPDSGGTPRPLTTTPGTGAVSHRWPHALPDGDAVLFSVHNAEAATVKTSIGWVSLATGETRHILDEGNKPTALRERYLVFVSDRVLKGVEFDLESATALGEPVSLAENVFVGPDGWVPYGVSDDGLLVYAPDTNRMDASIVRVDREGREELLLSVPGHGYRQPSLSPDGRRLALTYMPGGGEADLRLFDLERRTLSSITPGEFGAWPVWSPDGRHVAFVASTLGQWTVFSAAANGRGAVEAVIPPLDVRQIPTSYSPDGVLAFERGAPDVRDIWSFDASSEPTTRPFLATDASERGARFSPDGAWIAFTSNQSGRDEVYVARASGEGNVIPISNDGGREPMWARDSSELFYRSGTRMVSVPIVIGDDFDPGIPQVLFEGKYSYGYFDWAINYDVSPDGQYFYLAKESDALEPRLQVVTDWIRELERLIPVSN